MSRRSRRNKSGPKLVLPELYGFKTLREVYNYAAKNAFRDQRAFDFGYTTLLILRNDGWHLHASTHEQDPLTWLRFNDYHWGGARFGDVHLIHLGHVRGLSSKRAVRVRVNTRHAQWMLYCQPDKYYCLVDHQGTEYLYST